MSDDIGAASATAAPSAVTTASASPAPAVADSSAASPSETPATATPAQTPASTEPGPIPYSRFREVNESLREAKAFREKHGWVEQFHSDPMPFIEQWLDQLSGSPQHQAKLLAKAAKMLQSQRGKGASLAAQDEPAPDIPVMDAQGNVVNQTYSAKQLKAWQQWNRAQQDAELAERFGPLEQDRIERQQEQQLSAYREDASARVTELLTELRTQPHFTEHEGKIKQVLIDHPEWGDNVHRAYVHVLQTVVLPALAQTEQGKVMAQLKTQAAGGSVRPGAVGAPTTPRFKSHRDAMEYYSTHPEEAEAMANR